MEVLRAHVRRTCNRGQARDKPPLLCPLTIQGTRPVDALGVLCKEVVDQGKGVLVFCPSRKWTEACAAKIADFLRSTGGVTTPQRSVGTEGVACPLTSLMR
jgi:hypothetical protein